MADTDRAMARVDELADEISRRFETHLGREVCFGLDAGSAAQRLIEAAQHVDCARHRMGDPLTLAFLMPAQDAALVDKASDYSFKWVLYLKYCAKVRVFIDRAGKGEQYAGLYTKALHGSTEQVRSEARCQLIKLAGPFFEKALDSLKEDLHVYDPMNPAGPNGAWLREHEVDLMSR
ncbi:hypothetical protein [Pusillimonas noertemannii]|uniref:Uncharacterized protein n=1 Tax=Pusillimonas noertemannii TaxID=305977 RepID=A0A2U1CNX8_9BURK|nr:hypothetical protein [Pusillimonas noertemannii]NYT68269.1 hypothetical protein [Pusillimonas noertemannii]PVY62716.1 hypothetical protein C7440_2212 [Pusillimonas noertemannii]TFL10347.1 hypothetical protein CSC72_07340 [Pusillimonas noertemannii]